MNKLDLFETLIKNSAEAHEMPYEPDAWSQMDSKLNSGGSSGAGLNTVAACLSGLIIVGGLITLGSSINNVPQQNHTTESTYTDYSQSTDVSEKHETSSLIVDNSNTKNQTDVTVDDGALPANHISKMEQASVVIYDENTKEETVVEIDKLKDQLNKKEHEMSKDINNAFPEIGSYINEFKKDETDVADNKKLQDILPLPANATPCEGEKVEFDILMYAENQTTEWDFGDGYISSSRNPVHTYEKSGDYTVTLTTRFKDGNDDKVITKTTPIKVMAAPVVDFSVNTSDFAARPITTLKSQNGHSNSIWKISNGKKYVGNQAELIFNHKGSKTITLTEVAENGCEASKSKTVYIENDYNLLTPKALTCNGDGHNDDNWFPFALKVLDFPFEVIVMDKTGKTVYNTRTFKPWNGINNKTGENCPTGFYVWYVKLTNDKNQVEEYKGSLYLNRN